MALAATGALAITSLGCSDDPGNTNLSEKRISCGGVGIACTWIGIDGEEGFNGDGRHRLDTRLYWSMDLIFGQDGTPFFIDWNNHILRKVLNDDTVETVVGWTDPVFPGDGERKGEEFTEAGAAGLDVQLNHPTDLALLPDGTILVMAWHNHKLRAIDPATGRSRIIAGKGAGFKGDGGSAKDALFKQPYAVETDAEGNIYIGDQQNQRVRKISAADFTIETVAGSGAQGFSGDGGDALEASFNWEVNSNPEPSGGLALGGNTLYITDTLNHRIRALDLTTGIIDTVVGTGQEGYSGDGGAAIDATLANPRDIEVGSDDRLYIADTDNSVIRMVDLNTGIIETVVGTGELGLDEKGGLPATETRLKRPFGVALDPQNNLYVMDTINSRILRIEQE